MDDGAPGMSGIMQGSVGNVVVRAHRSSGEELLPPTLGNVENTFLTFLTFFNLSQERYATFFTCMILLLLTS